jgi:hypothetical protein
VRRWAASALLALVAGTGVAWGQGAWSVDPAGRGAVLQPFALPAGVAVADAALVVFCDADVPGGLNVNLWLGRPTGVAWPTSFEAATRRDQDAVRRDRWSSDGDRLAAPFYYGEVGRVIDDLRRGGSFAVRAFVLEGVADAAQPTYQFSVDGFAVAERQLGCAAAAPAAPTAPEAPPARTPSTRSAAPPPAPSAPAPPAPAPRPVVAWEALALGPESYAYAFGADAGLYVVCERGEPLVLLEVLGGPAFGRDFDVELSGYARLLERRPFEGPVEVLGEAGDPSYGFLALDVSAAAEWPIDVDAVFVDGSRVPLVTVEGGDGFYDALGALDCAAFGATAAPVAPVLVPQGFWVTFLDGDGLVYEDPTGDAYLAFSCFESELGITYVDPTFVRPREERVRLRFTGSAIDAQEHTFVSLGGGRYAADAFVALQVAYQAFFELGVAITSVDDPTARRLLVFGGGDPLRERYEALPCTNPG